jgi:hypothetical protein
MCAQAYIRCVSAVNGNWLEPLLARLKQVDVARLSHDPDAVRADPDHVVRVCACGSTSAVMCAEGRVERGTQARLPALVDGPAEGSGLLAQAAAAWHHADAAKRVRSETEVDDARQRYLARKAQRKR